jgi:hypothetical protein
MRGVRFDRLRLRGCALIVNAMKKDLEYRLPTSAELYALEQLARRERSREIARLLRAGASAVKSLVKRAIAVPAAKGVRHA